MSAIGALWWTSTTTITNAQVKTLPTSYVQLLAAPGSGKMIFPFWVMLNKSFSGGDYTNVNANGYLEFTYDGGATVLEYIPNDSGAGLTQLDNFLFGSNQIYFIKPQQNFISALNTGWNSSFYRLSKTDVNNKSFSIGISNGVSGNLTGGATANSLEVTTYYMVFTI